MTKNFKDKALEVTQAFSTSKDRNFLIDVFRYFEIEDYLINYALNFDYTVIKAYGEFSFTKTTPAVNQSNELIFDETVKTALEVFEYCFRNKVDKQTIRYSLIGVLFRSISKAIIDGRKSSPMNACVIFFDIHNLIQEHKRLNEDSFALVNKVISSKATTRNKMVFPLDILEDAKKIRFLQVNESESRQRLLMQMFHEYAHKFEVDYRKKTYSWSELDVGLIYFNFRNWLLSGNWNCSWAKNKAACLDWTKQIKQALEIFKDNDPNFSEAYLKKFYR